jgi:hypothetical protein
MSISLRGQGNPLPPHCPYKGEWLLENVMFLYQPKDQTALGDGLPEMTAGFRRGDGERCFGINSIQLASALGIDSEQVFEHNRAGTLFLESAFDVAPSHGSAHAKRYVFRIGDKSVGMTIEAGPTASV